MGAVILALWWHLPLVVHHALAGGVAGMCSGAIGAARADFHAYTTMRTPDEFRAYNWRVARFRWMQGAILGFVSGLGLGPVAGSLLS